MESSSAVVHTPIGRVRVRVAAGCVCRIEIGAGRESEAGADGPLAREAAAAIARWLEGGPWPTGVPLAPGGTLFQQRVWMALRQIPPGERFTYGELAKRLGTSPRAVGGACRANPIPLLIPCHRVVAAHGLGGFAGETEGHWLRIKRWLLEHE